MKIELVQSGWDALPCDALVLPFFEDDDLDSGFASALDGQLDGLIRELKDNEEWKAKSGQITVLYRPPGLPVGRLVLLGAGPRERYDAGSIRDLTVQAVRRVKGFNLKRVAVYHDSQLEPTLAARAAVEGVVLAAYDPDEYKTQNKSKTFLEEMVFASDQPLDVEAVERAMQRGEVLAQATNLARMLVNKPGNRMNPAVLASKAEEIAEKSGLEIEVLGEPEMEKMGMDAVLAVARGSDAPARFIVLKHWGADDPEEAPFALVGKGVTFDSGGLSLKPAKSMEDMKSDKAGACAVLGAMQAIAQLQAKRNVVGIIPAVENLPGGRAQRPGDVIRSMNGKTIQVVNTDAEGRLILADALTYVQAFNPRYILDIATLTGACVVALGHVRAGLFCNDDELCQETLAAAERSGEKLWRLPLDDVYYKDIESDIADVKNAGSRWGGAVTAAKFLQHFVDDRPWCHIDMAGMALYEEGQETGPTGFGVRTMAELVLGESD